VVYVSIESYRESKGRLGPVLRGSVQPESTVLAVHLRSGGIVYYQAHLNFQAFRANVTPILHSLGVTVSDGAPVASAAPAPTISVADELAKLAQLRDSGVLTEAEFATQKAKLLG